MIDPAEIRFTLHRMDTSPPVSEPVNASPDKDERMWAMIAHLSSFSGHFIPFGHVLGSLIIWIIKKDQYPLVDDQGKEAINFQITFTIYFLISIALCFVVIGFLITPLIWIAYLILVIVAGIKANDGIRYRYPATIRFIK
jgi:hypothetical protein